MFQNLVRRISGSFFLRPDRPWSDDATSNAPQIGRKRRLSDADRDEESYPSSTKRSKGGLVAEEERDESPVPAKETQDVKDIRKGVKEVELEDKEELEKAAAIPLPEDKEEGSEKEETEKEEETEEEETVAEPREKFASTDSTSTGATESTTAAEPKSAETETEAIPAVSDEFKQPSAAVDTVPKAEEPLTTSQSTAENEASIEDVPKGKTATNAPTEA
ncbi:hypothetical protein NEOLEDRAFT_903542 [Neolentinus lepideus HHB14362 ss-1]|uniref:Uncharacterized protein n=1 Tax=Neolentinus lepideus HHB14362 ss-1 TaxID=1314782 RepID=A0A165UI86_9AGAM|nr:hypothetical protein NEOLEDRAFT_903542 [Neolentinus lepideus HHB14362 ss-1]